MDTGGGTLESPNAGATAPDGLEGTITTTSPPDVKRSPSMLRLRRAGSMVSLANRASKLLTHPMQRLSAVRRNPFDHLLANLPHNPDWLWRPADWLKTKEDLHTTISLLQREKQEALDRAAAQTVQVESLTRRLNDLEIQNDHLKGDAPLAEVHGHIRDLTVEADRVQASRLIPCSIEPRLPKSPPYRHP